MKICGREGCAMLIKRKSGEASRSKLQAVTAGLASGAIDRRTFLQRSGLAAGGLAAIGSLQLGSVRKAEAAGTMTARIARSAARSRPKS